MEQSNKTHPAREQDPALFLENTTANLSHLLVFRSKCWGMNPEKCVGKLESRNSPAILIAHLEQSKASNHVDVNTKRYLFSDLSALY